MIFALETDGGEVVDRFVSRSSSRIGLGFSGMVHLHESNGRSWVVVVLEPLFPPIHLYLSLFIIGGVYIFTGLSPWLLWALVPLVVEVVLTSRFQIMLFRRGLKKAGYSGNTRVLSIEELLRGLLR